MKVHILVGFCLVAIVSGSLIDPLKLVKKDHLGSIVNPLNLVEKDHLGSIKPLKWAKNKLIGSIKPLKWAKKELIGSIVKPLDLACNSLGIEELSVSNILKAGDLGTSVIDGWCKIADDMELFVENDLGESICLNPLEDDESECLEDTERDLINRVRFQVHTRRNIETPIELVLNDVNSLSSCNLDLSRPTKLVVHGWQNSHVSKSSRLIKDALLENDDCNVILVDWSPIARRPYGWVSQRVPMIGGHVSKLIDWLIASGLDVKNLAGVGHCVGAHILGTASRRASRRLSAIFALDAAQHNFVLSPHRVCRDDADYVEAIHTNSGMLGMPISIGHADFRPNGGCLQAGCVGGSCAHARAYELYAESLVTKKGFVGKKCNNYLDFKSGKCDSVTALMGGAIAKPNLVGDFYLQTSHQAPYCL